MIVTETNREIVPSVDQKLQVSVDVPRSGVYPGPQEVVDGHGSIREFPEG